jgi:ATP-dependent RNA helicase RhlE
LLPAKRQNLLFSATFPDDIRKLADGMLHSPARVEVAPANATADRIEQLVHFVEKSDKRRALSWLIQSGDWRQVLVFTRTKHGANRLASQLEDDGLTAAAIHGNKSQAARTRALADFKANRVRVLVATDIAARGLDIDQLPHVVNYELPDVAEHYVHRIGRTGRAGREGVAVSLVSGDERASLKSIERLLGQRVPQRTIEGLSRGGNDGHYVKDARPRDAEEGRAPHPVEGRRPHRDSHAGNAQHAHRGPQHGQSPPRQGQSQPHGARRGKSRAARRRAARAAGRF